MQALARGSRVSSSCVRRPLRGSWHELRSRVPTDCCTLGRPRWGISTPVGRPRVCCGGMRCEPCSTGKYSTLEIQSGRPVRPVWWRNRSRSARAFPKASHRTHLSRSVRSFSLDCARSRPRGLCRSQSTGPRPARSCSGWRRATDPWRKSWGRRPVARGSTSWMRRVYSAHALPWCTGTIHSRASRSAWPQRASHSCIDLRREMALLRGSHRHLDPAAVWSMATGGGARALGLGDSLGRLEAGRQADFCLVQAEGTDLATFLDALTAGMPPVLGVWIAGERVGPRAGRAPGR